MATEIKEQTFAFTTLELAQSLVITRGDFVDKVRCKQKQGFYVREERGLGTSRERLGQWYDPTNDEEGRRKRFLLSPDGFSPLLVLVATNHP